MAFSYSQWPTLKWTINSSALDISQDSVLPSRRTQSGLLVAWWSDRSGIHPVSRCFSPSPPFSLSFINGADIISNPLIFGRLIFLGLPPAHLSHHLVLLYLSPGSAAPLYHIITPLTLISNLILPLEKGRFIPGQVMPVI